MEINTCSFTPAGSSWNEDLVLCFKRESSNKDVVVVHDSWDRLSWGTRSKMKLGARKAPGGH